MSDVPTKEKLLSAVRDYDRCIKDSRVPGLKIRDVLLRLDAIAPHSYISDLLLSAERERTDEEAIDEAIFRERLWHEHGFAALANHLTSQLTEALNSPGLKCTRRHYCDRMLRYLSGERQ